MHLEIEALINLKHYNKQQQKRILGFWNIWHAVDYPSFYAAAQQIQNPAISMIYGDITGIAAYVHAGIVPIRNTAVGHTGLFPVEGDGTRDWGEKEIKI